MLRKNLFTKPIYHWAKNMIPRLSETEREAMEAGDVWLDGDLFSGKPDWDQWLRVPKVSLSKQEKAFLEGPTEELCEMLDEWEINQEHQDLPPRVWKFIKAHKFFAMIIPRSFGGLDFSAYAQSLVIKKIASRSLVAAVTIMVPNSLGPGELLMLFGTKEQQNHWLPLLSSGKEVPCFCLTSPQAGSDAASMVDRGVVCYRNYKGKKTLGMLLNWEKRYITLGPIATVMGLAFKLYDPDHLLGEKEELGITLALIPTDTKGVTIGRRHIPAGQMFQNGPNSGKDVFVPLEFIIGGKAQIGNGWKMLMTALNVGRGISLPSLSAAGTALSAMTSGAYATVREQFNLPLGKFEGIQEALAEIAANAYLIDAGCRLTYAGLKQGYKPAVISAIMKLHATERMREAVIHAMDIHAGKSIIDGPLNYLGHVYKSLPIAITVEGANILTRNLIIFGQGSSRCHPWLLKEMHALAMENEEEALTAFDQAFWGHVSFSVKNFFRSWFHNWTGGRFAHTPKQAPKELRPYYRRLSRFSASFALMVDAGLLTLGGALKRKELLSARYGDILSELFLLSAVLKRWYDDGCHQDDLPLVEYCMARGFATIDKKTKLILDHLPNRFVKWLLIVVIQPRNVRHHGPSDSARLRCAETILSPSNTRKRLVSYVFTGKKTNPVAMLEEAFALSHKLAPIRQKMRKQRIKNIDDALKQKVITSAQAKEIKQYQALVAKVVAVDDFKI